jgi:hypothetical protein
MPISFRFIDASGENVKLDTVDREVCEIAKWPYSATEFSMPYQALTWTGLAIAMKVSKDGRTEITPDDVKNYVEDNPDCFPEPEALENLKKFLCGKYKFDTWYQRHK